METVFLLWHTREIEDGQDDFKLIGVYSSEENASSKIREYSQLPGFKDYPGGFEVVGYEIDADHWQEGFVTVVSPNNRGGNQNSI